MNFRIWVWILLPILASVCRGENLAELEEQLRVLQARIEVLKIVEAKKAEIDLEAAEEKAALEQIAEIARGAPPEIARAIRAQVNARQAAADQRALRAKAQINTDSPAAAPLSKPAPTATPAAAPRKPLAPPPPAEAPVERKPIAAVEPDADPSDGDTPALEIHPLREGDTKVAGLAPGKVTIRVYSAWTTMDREEGDSRLSAAAAGSRAAREVAACEAGNQVLPAQSTAATGGAFEFTLLRALNAGECVVITSGRMKAAASALSTALDFGRLRGYFSLGASVRQSQANFSQVDTFVGFTSDARILGTAIDKACTARAKQKGETRTTSRNRRSSRETVCEDEDVPLRLRRFRIQLNAFTDMRLGFQLAPATTAGATTATSGAPVETPFARPDQLTFNANPSGYYQLAFHVPMSVRGMDWVSDGKAYSFYIGPIGKAGVESMDAPIIASRLVHIDGAKGETDRTAFSTLRETKHTGALPFWGYGLRMGIFSYDLIGRRRQQRQVGNDPIAYLDVTWGKSKAFRSYQFVKTVATESNLAALQSYVPEAKPGVKPSDQLVQITSRELPRLSLEGRMKIPYLPALFGIDVNLRSRLSDALPNEFRFVVAFRVDAQKALGRIFGGGR